jgi:hypothetical protein
MLLASILAGANAASLVERGEVVEFKRNTNSRKSVNEELTPANPANWSYTLRLTK